MDTSRLTHETKEMNHEKDAHFVCEQGWTIMDVTTDEIVTDELKSNVTNLSLNGLHHGYVCFFFVKQKVVLF